MISKKTLIISVVIIAILVGAYFLLDSGSSENTVEDKKSPDTSVQTDVNDIQPIFEASKENINSVFIQNKEESYEFFLSDGTWKVRGNEDVLYNQAAITSIVLDYVSVKPVLIVEETSANASTYGFDNPSATSVVKTTDGSEATFYLGDLTKGGNGYYLMKEGSDAVYTISTVFGNNMLKPLINFRDTAILNIDAANISELTMSVHGVGEVNIQKLDEPMDVMTSWLMTSPYEIGVYDERFNESVLTPLISVSAVEFVSDNPTAEQLTESGFDNPTYFYEIKTSDDKVIRVDIGKNFEGYYILKRSDAPTVYLVSELSLSFLFADIFDYVHKYAYLPDSKTVTDISCNYNNVEYVLSQVTGNENAYYVNGNRITKTQFTGLYKSFFDIEIKGHANTVPENPDDIAFSYKVNKSDGIMDSVDFINMNGKYMYMSVNGSVDYYVFAEDVNKIIEMASSLEQLSIEPYSGEESAVDNEDDSTSEGFNWLSLVIAVLILALVASFPISLLKNSKNKK